MKIHFHGAEEEDGRFTWKLELPNCCLGSNAPQYTPRDGGWKARGMPAPRVPSVPGSSCWCHWLVPSPAACTGEARGCEAAGPALRWQPSPIASILWSRGQGWRDTGLSEKACGPHTKVGGFWITAGPGSTPCAGSLHATHWVLHAMHWILHATHWVLHTAAFPGLNRSISGGGESCAVHQRMLSRVQDGALPHGTEVSACAAALRQDRGPQARRPVVVIRLHPIPPYFKALFFPCPSDKKC